jgi:hypothetical protein
VLVILGLLTGGILTGQSLIRAAELRAVTTELQQYQTAVNTFKQKYFALPGDMPNATSFWTGGVTTDGDGDGVVEKINAASTAMETFEFWNHLARADMVAGEYTGVSGPQTGDGIDQIPGENVPASSISGAGFGIITWDWAANNSTSRYAYNYVNALAFGSPIPGYGRLTDPALTPEEAWNIDTKIDDGQPARGNVHAVNWNNICSAANDGSHARDDFDARYKLEDSSLRCALHFINLF